MPILMTVRNLALAAGTLALILMGAWINGLRWESRYNAYVAEIEHAHAQAQAQARAEEQRRQTEIERIAENAQTEITQARTDAAAADRAADGLRLELDRIKRRAASRPGATAGSQAGPDPAAVLADLLEEVEREGRAMAAEADRRGVAGATCERSYDALIGGW